MGLMPAARHRRSASGTAIPVVYHGGSVMRGVTIHTVFWAPSGYGFTGSPGARRPRLRAARCSSSSPMSRTTRADDEQRLLGLLGEYPDRSGGGQYKLAYNPAADSIDDTDPYPAQRSQCVSPAGVATCVTDLQLQQELDRVIQAHDPAGRGLHDLWFVFLPPNVDKCISAGSCGTNAFAGYHSLSNVGHGPVDLRGDPESADRVNPPPGSDPQGNPRRRSRSTPSPTRRSRRSPTRRDRAGWTRTASRSRTSARTARRSGRRSAMRPTARRTTS